jgi:hypothetical protein
MQDSAQQEQHLLDLDEIVLCHIIARLPEPACFAQTCKALLHASRNPLCRQLWFNRYGSDSNFSHARHITYACLSWRGLAADSTPQQLVQFLLSAIQASPTARQQHQELLKEASSLSKAGQWLQLLCLLAPRWQQLLLSAAAAHHSGVLAALLQGLPASKSTAVAPAVPSCSSHGDHQQLAAGHVTEPPASSSISNSQQPYDADQQQRATAKQLLFTTELPCALRLPTYRHDQLQSAIVSAAAAGQAHSLALLLQQLSSATCRNSSEKLDLLCSAMEAAAAAGSDACLATLWGDRSPASATSSCSSTRESLLTGQQQQLAEKLQQLQLGVGSLQGRQLQQRLLCSSRYCLIAAASSGNAQLLQGLLQSMPQGSGLLVTQQLPAALQESGRRGHVASLQLLLRLQEISSRPLQVCAPDRHYVLLVTRLAALVHASQTLVYNGGLCHTDAAQPGGKVCCCIHV